MAVSGLNGATECGVRGRLWPLPVLLFCLACGYAGAQDRSRVAVFVPPPRGGTQAQRTYFQDNFKMELIGANYPVAETREESLYTIMLDISDNPDYDSRAPVDEWNKPYDLGIKLERSADGTEIVNFGFAFDDLESMADWNLFLLYQAMANAAVPAGAEGGGEARDDRWRNKWLYLGFGAGLDMA